MDWPDKVSTYEPDMDMAHYPAQGGNEVHMHALSNCPLSQITNMELTLPPIKIKDYEICSHKSK